ncbi:MAG: sugar phosphate isomerase/epimerase [archaeon]|nr:sugar phosphate isomerase/epimerase [archaeon]
MKIRYSISNWIYGEEPIEKQFQRLDKFGLDAIELMIPDPEKYDVKEIKNLMEKYPLNISSICTMFEGAADKSRRRNFLDKEESVRKRTMKYLKGCIDIGNELGAALVLFVPSGVANVTDVWTEENKKLLLGQLKEIGDYAKSVGSIYAVIEPINRYENAFLLRGEQALELLSDLKHPQVKMMLDFFHTNIEEDNNGDAIRQAGKNLAHCHVAASNRKSPGRGMTDWFEIMRALRDIDYNGTLAGEPMPPTGANVYENIKGTRPEADLYTKEFVDYLKYVESVI